MNEKIGGNTRLLIKDRASTAKNGAKSIIIPEPPSRILLKGATNGSVMLLIKRINLFPGDNGIQESKHRIITAHSMMSKTYDNIW